MKKGNWNYTEPILYTVVQVLIGEVDSKPMHWQNAFAGELRQAVKISAENGYTFYIDNEDGSGLLKIQRGGGPDSYSAHLDVHFKVIRELPEIEWQHFDLEKHKAKINSVDLYQQEKNPIEFERLQSLLQMAKGLYRTK